MFLRCDPEWVAGCTATDSAYSKIPLRKETNCNKKPTVWTRKSEEARRQVIMLRLLFPTLRVLLLTVKYVLASVTELWPMREIGQIWLATHAHIRWTFLKIFVICCNKYIKCVILKPIECSFDTQQSSAGVYILTF